MDWATYLALCALLVAVFLGAFVAACRLVPPHGEGPARRRARRQTEPGPTTLDGTG